MAIESRGLQAETLDSLRALLRHYVREGYHAAALRETEVCLHVMRRDISDPNDPYVYHCPARLPAYEAGTDQPIC